MNDENIKLSIRVSKEFKNNMDKYKKEKCVDWSSLIRKFIENEIKKK